MERGREGEMEGGRERGREEREREGGERERGREGWIELTVIPHQPHLNPDIVTSVKQLFPHCSQRDVDGRLPSIQWCVIGS